MTLTDLLEPEEFVGRHWHRLTRGRSSLPRYPTAAVSFEDVSGALPVYFRGLGGDQTVRFAVAAETTSPHRLSRGLRFMIGEERTCQPHRDAASILLPAAIDAFDDRLLNRKLYFWLATFFVHMKPAPSMLLDPLARDLDFLCRTRISIERVTSIQGWIPTWRVMSERLLASRPERSLKWQERAIEDAIGRLLGGPGDGGQFWACIEGRDIRLPPAARDYRTFLPVLAWGDFGDGSVAGGAAAESDEQPDAASSPAGDTKIRKGRRSAADQTDRKDFLALNRFEKMLSLIESMNINRAVEDDDEEGARKALDDADEIRLASHSRKASTRLKVDLEVEAAGIDLAPVEEANYPEWDWRKKRLVPDCVHVFARMAESDAEPPESQSRDALIDQVRRRFESFRPKVEILRAQMDGSELDMEALVRAQVELRSTGTASERIYVQPRRHARDMSVALLADASLSTDSWIGACRVLDVEQTALLTLSHALTACGDEHALFTFTSRKRHDVRVSTLKEFDEPLSPIVERRIFSTKPGYYTRLGAAIRHVSKRLEPRPHAHRLLVVITDGKPNDIDHYEGRFGVEDTRHAIQEARRRGLTVFGITVDAQAQDYFPALFGRGGYAIVHNPAQLPKACVAIYRNLVVR